MRFGTIIGKSNGLRKKLCLLGNGTLVDIRTDEEKPELWENLYLNYHKKGLTFDSTQLKLEYEKLVKEEILRMKREGQKREEEAWGRSQKAEKEEAQGLSQKTEKEEACSQSQKTEKEEARYLSRVSEYDPEIDLTRVFAQLFEESKPTDPLIWDFGRYFRELSIEKLSLYPEARAMLLANSQDLNSKSWASMIALTASISPPITAARNQILDFSISY